MPHGLRDPPPRTRVGPQPRARAGRAAARHGPDRGPAGGGRAARARRARGHGAARRAAHLRPRRARPRRVLPVRPLLAGVAGDPATRSPTTSPSASWTCPRRTRWPRATSEPRHGLRADPLARSPRSPATATRSAGGRTSSSRAATSTARSRPSPRRWARCARPSRTHDPRRSGARRSCASRSARAPSRRRERRGRLRRVARAGARPSPARPRPTSARCKGLPKVKVATTWVPWTYGLLARASGYGAGVDSPAWYDQLFDAADDPVARWLSRAARLLRAEGLDATRRAGGRRRPAGDVRSPASATARSRASTSCSTPPAPCCATAATCRSRSCAPSWSSATASARCPRTRRWCRSSRTSRGCSGGCGSSPRRRSRRSRSTCGARSTASARRLLHRLNLLERAVGRAGRHARGLGDVQGGVPARVAAGARAGADPRRPLGHDRARPPRRPRHARGRASRRASPRWRTLADAVLLADLPDALEAVLRALADRAALDRDTADLMAAVPPLAGILRYGDVRGSDTSAVAAGAARDRPARRGRPAGRGRRRRRGGRRAARRARRRRQRRARAAEDEDLTRAWREALRRVADGDRLPGTLAGRATRLLHDAGELEPASPRHVPRPLPGEEPERGASWIEGFIGTSGLVLVHDPELLADPRRLDRDRPAGRVHQRPPAPAPRLLRPPAGRAPPPRRAPPPHLKGPDPFMSRRTARRRSVAAPGAGDRWRGCSVA